MDFHVWLHVDEAFANWQTPEADDVTNDPGVENFKQTTNAHLRQLGFPDYDWCGLAIQTVLNSTKFRGQDSIDLAVKIINDIIEKISLIEEPKFPKSPGDGPGGWFAYHVKRILKSGDKKALLGFISKHIFLQTRTMKEYLGQNRRWRRQTTSSLKNKDIPSKTDQTTDFTHLAQAIVAEIQTRQSATPLDQKYNSLAADVASVWLSNLPVELGSYIGPGQRQARPGETTNNRSPLMTQRELQAKFPQISLGTMNTQIMPRIKRAVLDVISKHGSGAAQIMAQKMGGLAV